MKIGVLALQGDFQEHCNILNKLDVDSVEIRNRKDMKDIDGLIIPGGESTTLMKLLRKYLLDKEIRNQKMPIFGSCAGAIVLAKEVTNPSQTSLKLIDIEIERNSYGRQINSFEADIEIQDFKKRFPAIFIRAPRIKKLGNGSTILAMHKKSPILLRNGRILISTFHPELTNDNRIHKLFLDMVKQNI